MDKKLSAVFQYLLYYQKTLIILHTGGYYMKLLIVRHGDPDYTIDSLTPKGWKEVDYLSEKTSKTRCESLLCLSSRKSQRHRLSDLEEK